MSEKIEKKGGTSGERKCREEFVNANVSVTAFELRRFADILQALAGAAEKGGPLSGKEYEVVPHKRIVRFRVCDLKIVDTWSDKFVEAGSVETVSVITGCEITPNRMTRGKSYCLCNDSESKMHAVFSDSEISPNDFVLSPGATIAISVSAEKIGAGFTPYGYTIWRVDEEGVETPCSETGGPSMGIQDPPGGG